MYIEGDHGMELAPLQYLQSMPPQRRHVLDEMALNLLTIKSDTFSPSRVVHSRL